MVDTLGGDGFVTPSMPLGPSLPKARTGIRGLDDITGGGLPLGRATLVTGGTGSGKTLLGLHFLVAGAREGAPAILVTFEESADKVAANAQSLGFDLAALQTAGILVVHSFQIDATEIVETGAFDFEPLFLLLADTIDRIGAQRIMLDTMEVLFGTFRDQNVVRGELARLFRWLEERGITAVITGERGGGELTRYGIEEYVSDCVIVLDHRVANEISTRRLRVVKYRGSAHGTNEYPFFISPRGFVVLPITSMALTYDASRDRVTTGVDRLDHMLAGGPFAGSTILISGMPGTGKTTLGATMLDAACARGERSLMISFEEAPNQVIRNMESIGLTLRRWVDSGNLRLWAARPATFGLEAHLALLSELLDELAPSLVFLDGLSSARHGPTSLEVTSMVARQLDILKARGITTVASTLTDSVDEEGSQVGVSSLVDTWLLLRNVETNGERNRLLFVIKSRGTAHSNQVREFVMSSEGLELIDVYVGPIGVLTGSARLAQEAVERDQEQRRTRDVERHLRELRRTITLAEARAAEAQADIEAANSEIDQIGISNTARSANVGADREVMSAHRWADSPLRKEHP